VFRPDRVVIQVNDGDLDELGLPGRIAETIQELRDCERLSAGTDRDHPVAVRPRSGLRLLMHECVLLKFAWGRFELLTIQEGVRWKRKWHGTELSADERAGTVPAGVPARLDSLTRVMRAVNPELAFVYVPTVRYFDGPPQVLYPLRREFYREFALRNHVMLVDPTDAIFAEFRRTGQPSHGFSNTEIGTGHLNARGHALVGRLLADALEGRVP
jgi:hypothetical protein